jgi:hypothetical protein
MAATHVDGTHRPTKEITADAAVDIAGHCIPVDRGCETTLPFKCSAKNFVVRTFTGSRKYRIQLHWCL